MTQTAFETEARKKPVKPQPRKQQKVNKYLEKQRKNVISHTNLKSFSTVQCIYGWVGGQQNAIFTTIRVQTRVRTWTKISKNANFICESSLCGLNS